VFEKQNGSFMFMIAFVQFSKKDNKYRVIPGARIAVCYEFIDEQTILLSVPVPNQFAVPGLPEL